MNFNALKIIKKIHKKIIKIERLRPDNHTSESTCGLVHVCKIREKTDKVLKFPHFHEGTSLVMALGNRRTNRSA